MRQPRASLAGVSHFIKPLLKGLRLPVQGEGFEEPPQAANGFRIAVNDC